MKYDKLFETAKIGSLTLKNRFIMGAMGVGFAEMNGNPTDRTVAYYEERAKGGYALIITEVTRVQDTEFCTPLEPSLGSDKFIPGWKKVTDAVHAQGAYIFPQLHQPGRQYTKAILEHDTSAPSPIACPVFDETPHELMDYTLKLLLSELPVESSQIQALTNCDFFMTFSLSLPEKRKEREYLYYLRDQIIQDSSKIHSFPYEENLFVLINYKEEKELDQFFVRLKKLLKEYQIHAGSSNSFEDLTQLKYYFEQAVKVRSFGEKLHPEKKFYSFTEYYVYFFISRIPLELSHTLLCQDYLTLVEYDHVHSLQLVDTITAYFYHSMNINDVSKELHVHRNTISYRLNLIKEKLLIDYTDIRKLRNIVLSHEVKKWNGRLPS